MKDFAGFPPQTIALISAVSIAYFLFCWAPVFWPFIATHKERRTFPRRWLFIATILSMSYGTIIAFLTLITLPAAAYDVFIAPTLSVSGFNFGGPLIKANRFVTNYWWLLLPPALLLNTFYLVRKLKPVWVSVCKELTAN